MSHADEEYADPGISPGPGGVGETGGIAERRRRIEAGRARHERTARVSEPDPRAVRAAEERVAALQHDDRGDGSAAPPNPSAVARIGRATPGVARVATEVAVNTAAWSWRTSLSVVRRLLKALADPDEASRLADELGITVGTVGELGRKLAAGTSLQQALVELAAPDHDEVEERGAAQQETEVQAQDLRRQGQALLARSRDVWANETAHPAFARILDELAPDEARILLLMCEGGPQPSVDVRTGGPVSMVSSELLAPGLTMIGSHAGVRYDDFVPSYLSNLERLGLIWFSRESLRSPKPYQVLEAQPDVIAALHSVKFAKVVRRSIHLTPFGRDFCVAVLSPERTDDAGEQPGFSSPE